VEFDEQRNGDQVEVAPGAELDVTLLERPTSGFRWNVVSSGEPACRLSGDRFDADTQRHGGSGARVLRFVAIQPGEGVIELAYRRSWETNTAPARRFVLGVRVASG
jgi:inhibitor of cysteine peptidase